VFLSKSYKEWTGSNSASATLNKVLRRGCEAIRFFPICEEGEETNLRVHDLRHTFAYITAKAGADLGDLQYLMGHSDVSQTMRYRGFIQSRAKDFVGQRNNPDLMNFVSF
jgi:integrase